MVREGRSSKNFSERKGGREGGNINFTIRHVSIKSRNLVNYTRPCLTLH